jgi:hypothetical protein
MSSQPPLPSHDPWVVDLSDRVSKLPKVKAAETPAPVIARAEQLCDLVDSADGIRPDRQDLIAALVLAAAPDGAKLADVWRTYRTAPAHQVVLNQSKKAGPLDLNSFKKH